MSYTWLITGASSGLGASIALAALRAGHKVIGTARDVAKAQKTYPDVEKNGGSWVQLDVNQSDAQAIVDKVVREQQVTVLVNNAAYAYQGPLEELSNEKIRAQWETNLFGLLACTRGAIPSMRTRRTGTIVNVSSTAGMRGVAGFSMYCGTKFAVEGVSEALAGELEPFNIRVLIVQPGSFRTNFQVAAEKTDVSSAYAGTPAEEIPKMITSTHGKQPGDPDRAAEAIVEVVTRKGRGADEEVGKAIRMAVGKDAVQRALGSLESWQHDVKAMRPISESAVYPDA